MIHAEHNGLQDSSLVELSRHDEQLITAGSYDDDQPFNAFHAEVSYRR